MTAITIDPAAAAVPEAPPRQGSENHLRRCGLAAAKVWTIPLLAALALVSPARADVVSVTTNIAGTNIFSSTFTSPGGSDSFGKTIAAAFTGFDASLGTLTGVSFSYDYEYSFVFNAQGPGGGGGGLNSPLRINGAPFLYSSGSEPGFINLGSSSDFAVTGTAAADTLSVDLSTYTSDYTFELFAAGGIGGGGPGFSLTSSLDLLPSSVTVTYTFDQAPVGGTVPEPSSLALLGAAGVALALQRRRKTVRRLAPTGWPMR